jgi:RimJ/RimL family protein N-acetyltransferase
VFEPVELPAGDGLLLRPFRVEDADDVAVASADPLTRRFLPFLPSPYTRDDALWWITTGIPAGFAAGGATFAVTGSDGRVLASVGINRVRPEGDIGEVGYWAAPWARGRGVTTAAVRALTAHAFRTGMSRLELHTAWENEGSQRVAIAAGYTREGVARGASRQPDGGRRDHIVWARLATDPAGPTRRLLPDLPHGGLTDGVVTLRRMGPGDVDDVYALRQLPDVVATSVPPHAPSRDEVAVRCARVAAAWLAGDRAPFTIRDTATGAFAGEIGIYYQEPPTGQAMIGYSIAVPWRGKGYATRATRLVAEWAFTRVGVARLIAGTAPENVGSQRVLEAAGFRREGYQRSRLPGMDGRIDDVLFALLPSDAQPHQNTAAIIT